MTDFLIHYGVKGQKWGERRYQYQDGAYTPEGRIHYGIGNGRRRSSDDLKHATEVQLSKDPITPKEKKKILSDDAKKALMIVGGVALAAGVAYGVYAVSQNLPPETTESILEAIGVNGSEGSSVSKDVSNALNSSISEATNHEYTIDGSERANELFNRVMNEPMKFASHHLNPVTFDYDQGELSDDDYNSINAAISRFMKTEGIPDSVLIKNTPGYGLDKVPGYGATNDNARSVYEFAKKNPDVLAFSNSMFADAWGRDNMIKENELTPMERKAAVQYSGAAYNGMNNLLRGTYNGQYAAEWRERNNDLTHAINKHELPKDVMVHRAIKLDNDILKNFFNQENVVGQTFFDPAFGSASLSNYDTAQSHGDKSRAVIHAIAPKGTKAMYMETLTTSPHELELLLQRGSGYKIADVVKDSNGRITDIFAQIVQNGNLEDI